MKRFYTIMVVLFIGAAIAAVSLFRPQLWAPAFEIASVRYDVNADGSIDLIRWDLGGEVTLWEWDRNNDGQPELTGFDAVETTEGGLQPTGAITAWDWGADSVIDAGNVATSVEQILQREEVVAARSALPSTDIAIALVGADIRALVSEIENSYDDFRLANLRMPIVGSTLPDLDTLLPGAARAYRNGIHQGFDMNNGHIGVPTAFSGPVVAIKDGTVIRATLDFTEMTPEEYAKAIATSQAAGTTPPQILDKLRGKQVWIDHGHEIVSRYVHLSGIASEIVEGKRVRAGDIIGFVGNSGTESAVNGGRSGAHLHFELRIDNRYFGEGMSRDEIREIGSRLFHVRTR
jgi:murein DD-endopeptidase MepM/ murein hydrolase activator NlpD